VNEQTTKNWILKAESDLKIGEHEIIMKDPATDAICFHTQQCAEKYLKAFLIFHGKEVKRTHDIAMLIEECSEIDSDFRSLYEINADRLTEYAVELRYSVTDLDDLFPPIEETQEAITIAEKVKDFVLEKLNDEGF
jgi:HEPN domain-containing protein